MLSVFLWVTRPREHASKMHNAFDIDVEKHIQVKKEYRNIKRH